MSSDVEILSDDDLPPEGIYARVAQDADLDVVVRAVALDLASELAGVTKENVVEVARAIADFMLTGQVAKKEQKRGALAVVKTDSSA